MLRTEDRLLCAPSSYQIKKLATVGADGTSSLQAVDLVQTEGWLVELGLCAVPGELLFCDGLHKTSRL